jgi:TPP-dependent pyruvate/acetoin dehydrogenase alpha subunit
MEYTPIGAVTAVEHPAADRAAAYGLDRILVDGNDPDTMWGVATETIERARAGAGPSLVEAVTYRHGGHSRADPANYRPEEETRAWLDRDPVPAYREALLSRGVAPGSLAAIDEAADLEIDEATAFATASPAPGPALIERDVWSDGGSAWRS